MTEHAICGDSCAIGVFISEGASLPEALIDVAASPGIAAMALLDRNGFYGSPRFHMAAKKSGLRGHVGAELSG